MKRPAVSLLLGLVLALHVWPAEKKRKRDEEKEVTQKLETLKDPPLAVTADTQRLAFQVTPLSAKGLLSQQVRDALKWLLRESHGNAIVKLRAFVAGTGDVRRVQTLVSEVFTDRHLPIPALTVIQAGALPLEGSQVIIESTEVARKPENPHGVAFLSGQLATIPEPLQPVAPLVRKSLNQVTAVLRGGGMEGKDVLRATCFVSSLDDIGTVRQEMASLFPAAAMNIVQTQRIAPRSLAECEAVARLGAAQDRPLKFLNAPDVPVSPLYSQAALVSAPKLALTGSQLAFGEQPADARMAFERLGKALEQAGASYEGVALASIYPLSGQSAALVRKVRTEFYKGPHPPASTMTPFEGLPSVDASFAVDLVATIPESK
jgi:enamine deaminase RidA (YjgF/YER057c/UK114 family)